MGKLQQATPSVAGSLERSTGSTQTGTACRGCDSLCSTYSCRMIVTLILSVQLLVFSLFMFHFHGNNGKAGSHPLLEVPIAASFRVRKSPSYIHSHLRQLERNISEEIGFPGKVAVVSIDNLPNSKWTEVTIGVPLQGSNNVSTKLQILKATFVKFFLRERNLSLPSSTFGKVANFQVEKFPGGITVVPEPSSLSHRRALFNFTIHTSLSHLASRYTEFKLQLTEGLCLEPDENLVTQLTNLNGSTSRPPVIVQISVFDAVGCHLPYQRLKQLAQHVRMHLSKNLGLNDTMFGRVHKVELSSLLKYILEPHKLPSSPSSAPSPSYRGAHNSRHSHHRRKSSGCTSAVAPEAHSPDLPPQGSISPHARAPAAYAPSLQTSSPSTASLLPASTSFRGSSPMVSPPIQARQGDSTSPVQPPQSSSCKVSKTLWMTLMPTMPVAALLI